MIRRLLALALTALLATASAQTTIEFWYAFTDAPRSGWIQDRIAEFNDELAAQNSPYRIEGANKGSYRETLEASVLAARQGNPPHLVQLFEVGSQLAVDAGIFRAIDGFGEGIDLSDYIEPVLNYYTIGGRVYSIPFNSSSPILYANETLLERAGLSATDLPETFGELLEACATAKAAGVGEACITFPLHTWFFEQWVAQQGAPLVNNGNGRDERATEVLLTSDAALNVGQFMKDLADGGYYSYTGRFEDWAGSEAIFGNQQSIYFITSTADAGNIIRGAGEAGFDVATGLLPIPDGATRNGVVIGGASVWLTEGNPDVEAVVARDFVLYMTNTENMSDWHKLTGYYPVRVSSVDMLEAEGWFVENPEFTIAFTQLSETLTNQATAGALLGTFLDTRTIVAEALQKIYQGSSTVEEAMAEAKRQADAVLAEYNANF
jgi:sn-glycerol 3-phosphate transport system substrate-binding protein